MEKISIYDYQLDEIVPVFHWGKPAKMKVIGYDELTRQVQLQYIGSVGSCYSTVENLKRMAEDCKNYVKPITVPDLFTNLYTDATGQCFSDADPGL